MLRLASSLVRDVAALHSRHFGSHGTCSILCPQTSQQAKDQTRHNTLDIQPSAEELVAQDNLLPSPLSPFEMEASTITTASQPLPPQSHVKSFLQLELRVKEALENDGIGASGSQSIIPLSMKRYKWTTKRIVKRPPICKSLFVA